MKISSVIDGVTISIVTVVVIACIALIASHDGADRELFDKVCAKEFARPITVKFMGESPRRRHVAATLCCAVLVNVRHTSGFLAGHEHWVERAAGAPGSARRGATPEQGTIGAEKVWVHLSCFDSAQRLQEARAYDLGEKK